MNIAQTINRCIYGMSDDQRDREYAAQKRLEKALADLWEAIHFVNANSTLVTISRQEWADCIHDVMPTMRHWDEKITEARHG
jgi:hypothetical protein